MSFFDYVAGNSPVQPLRVGGAESTILSAGGAESMMLSVSAESIILSAGGAEGMMLLPTESLMLSA